jgi:peptidoglycan hydrolase FlgJ
MALSGTPLSEVARTPLSGSLAAAAVGSRNEDPKALQGVVQEFEAFMLKAMLKGMRDASGADGFLDNDQTRMYTDMLDQQFAAQLSKRGIGLAEALLHQLTTRDATASNVDNTQNKMTPDSIPRKALESEEKTRTQGDARAFIERMRPHAERASHITGIPTNFILGQAALESGWGKREIRHVDGSNSFNLFGIKASGKWAGNVAQTLTTEYVDGQAIKKVEKFRAYGSYAEAFADYARLLKDSPRYAKVIANATDAHSFAEQIARAGYATDPRYAQKLHDVIRFSSAV